MRYLGLTLLLAGCTTTYQAELVPAPITVVPQAKHYVPELVTECDPDVISLPELVISRDDYHYYLVRCFEI